MPIEQNSFTTFLAGLQSSRLPDQCFGEDMSGAERWSNLPLPAGRSASVRYLALARTEETLLNTCLPAGRSE